jgi:hypothetical protein
LAQAPSLRLWRLRFLRRRLRLLIVEEESQETPLTKEASARRASARRYA